MGVTSLDPNAPLDREPLTLKRSKKSRQTNNARPSGVIQNVSKPRTTIRGKNLFLISAFLFPLSAFAQLDTQWVKYYGGPKVDVINDHIQMSDGGFAFTGYTRLDTLRDEIAWIVRTDTTGEEIWSKTLSSDYRCQGYEIVEGANHNLAILGINFIDQRGGATRDILCASLSSEGDSLWMKTYGGAQSDVGRSGLALENGDFLICGYTKSFGNGGLDMFLLRVNEDGDSLWMKTYGSQGDEDCNEVIQTLDGGFALIGSSYAQVNAPQSFCVVFTDSNGDSLWSFTSRFDQQATCSAYTMQQLNQNLFIVAGSAGGSIDLPNPHLWVVAFDNRRQLWDIVDGRFGQRYFQYALTSCKVDHQTMALTGVYYTRNNPERNSGGFWIQEITYDGWLGDSGFWESDSPNVCNSIEFNHDRSYSIGGNTEDGHNIDSRNQNGFLLLSNPRSNNVKEQHELSFPSKLEVGVFPNPSNGPFSIEVVSDNLRDPMDVWIVDLTGKQVFREQFVGTKNRRRLDWGSQTLTSGTYFLHVKQGNLSNNNKLIRVK